MGKYSIGKVLLTVIFFSFLSFINWTQANTQVISIENPLTATSVEALVGSIINFLVIVALALSSLMIVIAGYHFVTAGGDPKKIDTAKKIILYTLIGLGIIMFAKAVNSILKLVIGLKQ